MKKPLLFLLTTIFILGLLIQPGCKTSDDSADQYTLTVTLGTGVTGTPISGSYPYDENQAVPYSYTLQTGYVNLVVTLDGIPIANSGVITMNSNHTLTATAGEPTVEYTLEVQVGTGVSGIPTAGSYTYDENEIVTYSYTLQTGYENLEVTLDGIPIADSGVITMNSNHTLKSMSDEEEIVYDIRGTWAITYTWAAAVNMPARGTMHTTFVGSPTSGTWTNDEGHNGTYTVNGMAAQWVYTSGTTYTGNFTTQTAMNGTMISYTTNTGTWNATKM